MTEDVERMVTRARRGRALLMVAGGLVCFAAFAGLGGAIFANVVNGQQDTKLERFSACEDDPGGKLCQRIKRESDEARSIKDTCRNFWKVGYPCPKPGSKAAARQVRSTPAGELGTEGGGEEGAPAATAAPASPPSPADGNSGAGEGTPAKHPANPKAPEVEAPTGKPAGEGGAATDPGAAATIEGPPVSTPEPEAAPESPTAGILDNPGGLVGDIVCSVNRLTGLTVCTE